MPEQVEPPLTIEEIFKRAVASGIVTQQQLPPIPTTPPVTNEVADNQNLPTSGHHGESDLAQQMRIAAPSRRGWYPTDAAIATAREAVELVSIPVSIARYKVVKAEKKQTPSSAEWLRWILADEQKAITEKGKQDAEAGRKKSWHSVAD